MNALELAEILEFALEKDNWCQECGLENTKPIAKNAADMLRQQEKEISSLKKQIHQLSVLCEPKIGDRVILLDDESEGVIESLSIAGGPRINFDDGAYGNYTRLELITLFAYKEKD
jgi:hypothetical protein